MLVFALAMAQAQPLSIGVTLDTTLSTMDTISIQAYSTCIVADMTSGSGTLVIDAPSERWRGFEVVVVQMNAGLTVALTVNSTGAGNDFQTSDTASSSYTFMTNMFTTHRFRCTQITSGTYRWCLIE